MLTKKQIKLVQDSWSAITPVSQKMGEQFYTKLFERAPELKPMFKSDPKDQAMKLMFMLSYMVYRLEHIDELREEITKLANRHKDYGTEPRHYAIIGENLLWSLEQNLGAQWTQEMKEAWDATYQMIANLMINPKKAA